ncbi:MAG: hypothetical protein ACOX9R_16645 [Armatimonadota bacterium]
MTYLTRRQPAPSSARSRVTICALLITALACAHASAQMPAPEPTLLAIEAESHDEVFEAIPQLMEADEPLLTGPQLYFTATDVGWVYNPSHIFVLTGSTRPWRVFVAGDPLVHDDGNASVPRANVEVRDLAAGGPWQSLDGTPMFQNLSGNPDQYIELEFRILVEYGHIAGHYQGDVTLSWAMPASGGLPATSGVIPLTLHLDVPEFFSVSTDVTQLRFPEESGASEGWIYSETGHLYITSNRDYQISLSQADDLTGPEDFKLPTAMILTNVTEAAPEWASWGYLGGTAQAVAETPWAGDPDDDSPWPGSIGTVHETYGSNTYEMDFGAFRGGLGDPEGEYSTTIVITVAVH